MKHLIILNILLLYSLQLFAQVYLHPQGMAYYKEGATLLENGDYYQAEKSLTIALNTLKDENVYMKRGIARLYQEDTVGFCEDMNMAANKYFNLQSSLLFNNVCCEKVDTLYFHKNMQPASSANFRYFEEVKYPKYDNENIGIFHDIRVRKDKFNTEYGRDQSNLGKNYLPPDKVETKLLGTTDIIAVYEEKDSVKNYLVCTKSPKILNQTKYGFVKNSLRKEIKNQFYNLKVEENVDLTVYYELYLNKKGSVTDIKVIGTYPEVDIAAIKQSLEKVISKEVENYPSLKPAIFKGKPVNFIAIDYVTF
ncbi:MAG TPA: hypothetical protein VIN10_07185 [Bacteroidales bacterium]